MMILLWFLLIVFILVCVLVCFLVLIQSDKGGGISGAIGGGLGGANSLLGTQDTANILTRGTMIFGGGFLVLCIVISLLMSHQTYDIDKSLLQKRAEKQQSYSPSSVLDNRGGGLPIKPADEQGVPAAEQSPGLPMVDKAPEASQTSPAPDVKSKVVPVPGGALPIKPSPDGGGGTK